MKQVEFKEQNAQLKAPEGQEDNVQPLPIAQAKDEGGTPQLVSCWELSDEELEEVKKTGRVYLHVVGQSHPVVHLTGLNPFKQDENQQGDDDQQDHDEGSTLKINR